MYACYQCGSARFVARKDDLEWAALREVPGGKQVRETGWRLGGCGLVLPQFVLGGSGANAPTTPIILPMTTAAPAAQDNAPVPAQAARWPGYTWSLGWPSGSVNSLSQ